MALKAAMKLSLKKWNLKPRHLPVTSFYDQLYDAIRNGDPPPVDPATARETIRVMSEARNGTRFSD